MSNKGKSKKGVLFFLAAMAGIVVVMLVANYHSRFVRELNPPEGGVRKLFTSGNSLIAVSNTNKICIWNWKNLSTEPRRGGVKAQDVTWMEPGRLVWIPLGEADTLVVSNLKAEKEYKRMSLGLDWQGKILRTSRNGKFTVAGMVDVSADRSDTKTGGRIRVGLVNSGFEKISEAVTISGRSDDFGLGNIAVSEDGAFVAIVGSNNGGWIAAADMKQKKILWEKVPKGTAKIDIVTFSPDGKMLYAEGPGLTVYGFEVATGKIVHEWVIGKSGLEVPGERRKYITAVNVSPDSRMVFTVGSYTRTYVWDAVTGKHVGDKALGHQIVVDFAFSPDSSRLATAGTQARRRKIKVWRIPIVQ